MDVNIHTIIGLGGKLIASAPIPSKIQETMRDNNHTQKHSSDWFAARMALKRNGRSIDVEQELKAFKSRHKRDSQRHTRTLWLALTAAACIIGCIITGLEVKKEKTIQLAKTTIVKADSVVIMSGKCKPVSIPTTKSHELVVTPETNKEAQQLVVTIPQGEYYTIVLSDQSKIYLHAGSRVYFPTEFDHKRREVELVYGEAYFQVTHDERRPFVVKTRQMETTVLGTEFDIATCDGQNDCVTLITGSVNVSHGSQHRIIRPGQQATVGHDGLIDTKTVDTEKYVAWRDGLLYFDDMTLHDIMEEIGRNYNCSVEYADRNSAIRKYHFVTERSVSIDSVVSSINKLRDISVERRGQTLYVR